MNLQTCHANEQALMSVLVPQSRLVKDFVIDLIQFLATVRHKPGFSLPYDGIWYVIDLLPRWVR